MGYCGSAMFLLCKEFNYLSSMLLDKMIKLAIKNIEENVCVFCNQRKPNLLYYN